jgi:metal-sulfur cluster biosynthetic enzyme
LTARGCPMSAFIAENVKGKIEVSDGVNRVNIQMV